MVRTKNLLGVSTQNLKNIQPEKGIKKVLLTLSAWLSKTFRCSL